MVHCCLPVLCFVSINKKGWIVLFLALPSLPDVFQSPSVFSFPCPFCSSFIHSPFTSSLSLSLMLPVVASLFALDVLSLYLASSLLIHLPPAAVTVQNIDKQQHDKEALNCNSRKASITPKFLLLFLRQLFKRCLNWQAAMWLLSSMSCYSLNIICSCLFHYSYYVV